jgi:hypothetical protein
MATQIHDTVSTAFRHFMTEICIFLSLYILASKSQQLLITANATIQTNFKGNFCLITVYTHKTFPQPQNLNAKKQTFSNNLCSPFAPPKRGLG